MISELLDEGYQVTLTMKESIPVNDGIVDEYKLDVSKRKVMSFAIDYIKTDFIEVKKGFPIDNIAEVDLSIDMVIMKGEDFRRLRKLAEKYE